jgi:hypothetical protein
MDISQRQVRKVNAQAILLWHIALVHFVVIQVFYISQQLVIKQK